MASMTRETKLADKNRKVKQKSRTHSTKISALPTSPSKSEKQTTDMSEKANGGVLVSTQGPAVGTSKVPIGVVSFLQSTGPLKCSS
jgi:hypothetical protein